MDVDIKVLSDFINTERNRFDGNYNNLFAFSFYAVYRYYDFLRTIHNKYEKLVKEYSKVFSDFQKTIIKEPGSHEFTSEQMQLDNQMTELATEIQLEIESFYQFAKILLDKIAFSIEYYFGQRGKQIRGHHYMIEKLQDSEKLKVEEYCEIKSLKITKNLLDKMIELQKDISDFRDDYISHLRSPRIFRGMSIDGRMIIGRLYPQNEKDTIQQASKSLFEILNAVEEYIILVVEFINDNKSRTALPLKGKVEV